jgi:release factor glutamine methyltransferase
MSTIRDILIHWQSDLDSLDVELLIAHGIGKSREFVLTYPEYEIAPEQFSITESLLQRRLNHEPIAYILGHREFFGLDFTVTSDTLIPRPETEFMVDKIICDAESRIKNQKFGSGKNLMVDVGTGSGCIIISLAHELLKNDSGVRYDFFGVDISQSAIAVARENARMHAIEKNITFTQSDLLENISQSILDSSIETLIIAANLPYLSHTIYQSSIPDVRNFEPQSALVSDEDGLWHYRKLLDQIQLVHKEKKSISMKLFFEISPEQKTAIEKLIRNYFPKAFINTSQDLSGKYRLVIATV